MSNIMTLALTHLSGSMLHTVSERSQFQSRLKGHLHGDVLGLQSVQVSVGALGGEGQTWARLAICRLKLLSWAQSLLWMIVLEYLYQNRLTLTAGNGWGIQVIYDFAGQGRVFCLSK